jgi:hypothetical protein
MQKIYTPEEEIKARKLQGLWLTVLYYVHVTCTYTAVGSFVWISLFHSYGLHAITLWKILGMSGILTMIVDAFGPEAYERYIALGGDANSLIK